MAIQQVQYVGPSDQMTGKKGTAGGAGVGSQIGAAVGAIAGAATTGGAGAVQGGLTGAAAGGALGGWIDPAKADTTAIQRRIQSSGPQIVHSEQSEQLKQSLVALQQQPQDVQHQYAAPLIKAYIQSVAQDNPQTGMA